MKLKQTIRTNPFILLSFLLTTILLCGIGILLLSEKTILENIEYFNVLILIGLFQIIIIDSSEKTTTGNTPLDALIDSITSNKLYLTLVFGYGIYVGLLFIPNLPVIEKYSTLTIIIGAGLIFFYQISKSITKISEKLF